MELIKVMEQYRTQGKCIAYLEKQRWNNLPTCPYCGSTRSTRKRKEYRYTCHACGRSYSVLVGTIFESTRLPINKWFIAICLILNAKKGISSLQLARDIKVNKNTAWYLQKRIRQAMQDNDNILQGIIEIDETYVGGSLTNKDQITKVNSGKYHRTGMEHKVPILGMLEKGGRVKLKILNKAWGQEIKPLVKMYIDKNSTIVTDGFGAYFGLDKVFDKHVVLNHSEFEWKKDNYSLSTLEGYWTILKRAITGQYHKITRKHLQDYLNELTFKHNNKKENMFNVLINNLLLKDYAFS